MKKFQDLRTPLLEGVYDPNIFKAFFLAGGPGSGKSYVVRRTTGGTGLKIVNSDPAFESLLKKDSRNKMVITNYSFFSIILNQKLYSPSRVYT